MTMSCMGQKGAVNPDQVGSKARALHLTLPPSATASING